MPDEHDDFRSFLESLPKRDYFERVLQQERRALRWTLSKVFLYRPLAAIGFPGANARLIDLLDAREELRYAIEEHESCLAASACHGVPSWGGFVMPADDGYDGWLPPDDRPWRP